MTDTYDEARADAGRALAAHDTDALTAAVEAMFERYLAEREVNPLAGSTTSGLPYPSPTDPVTQGADAIRNLAVKVDGAALYGGFSRARAAAASSGYVASQWTAVPVDTETDINAPSTRAFTFVLADRGYTINTNGIYVLTAVISMSAAGFVARLITASGTVIAQQANDAAGPSQTVTVSAVRFLTAGSKVSAQVFPAGAYSTPLDAQVTPVYLAIAALPRMPV